MSGTGPYRWLVRLVPRNFRERWGDEMAAVAADLMARERRRRGRTGAVLLACRLAVDASRVALLEHLRPTPLRPRSASPYDHRRTPMLEGLAHDVRSSLRAMRRSPGHALAVVLTLGLGIGANAAIFSVVRSVLLEAVPYPDPDRLVLLAESNVERDWHQAQVAPANFLDWQSRARTIAASAGFSDWFEEAVASGGGPPERVRVMLVAGDLFGVLGEPPALGRSFREEETWGEAARVVVLSHGFWQRRFAGNPDIVGQRILFDGSPHTVVGVMPKGFSFWSDATDAWKPFGWAPEDRAAVWFRRAHLMRGVGRLAPGATLAAAQAELAAIAADLERQYPDTNKLMRAEAVPLHEWLVGDVRRPLLVLFAAVGLVLLIASVNVAHLQLARATARRTENAVRGSLGASRWVLARRALVESLLLAVLGAALGVGLAAATTRGIVRLGESFLPRAGDVRVDGLVLAFAVLLAAGTAAISGLAPALRGARVEPATLAGGARAGESRRSSRGRQRLVAAELAFATIVLVGTLLLVRSMAALARVEPGFEPAGVMTAAVSIPATGHPDDAAVTAFQQRFLLAVRALPGVEAAGMVRRLPLTGTSWTSDFAVEGRGREEFGTEVMHREVSVGYFEALRVPLVTGRRFDGSEDAASPPVVLVNQALADRHFPGKSPVGQRLCFDRYPDEKSIWRTIVGVVGSERLNGLGAPPRPEIFAPLTQDPTRTAHLVVRSSLPPASLAPALRRALHGVDPGVPLYAERPLEEVVASSVARERFLLTLFALFAGLAVTLATIGVYGTTAEAVAMRRREIGVRLAVGARGGEIVALMVHRQAAAALVGVAVGLAGAVGLGRAMQGLLHGVPPSDVVSMAGAAGVLLATSLLAAWLPARHTARVEPLSALR